jgi:glucose-6-phosphate-specific signal transduction histidine kinase
VNDDANLLLALVQRYWAWIGGALGAVWGLGKAAQRFAAMEAKMKDMGEQIEAIQQKTEADNDALASRIEAQTRETLTRIDATNKVLGDLALTTAGIAARLEMIIDPPAVRRRRTTQD